LIINKYVSKTIKIQSDYLSCHGCQTALAVRMLEGLGLGLGRKIVTMTTSLYVVHNVIYV